MRPRRIRLPFARLLESIKSSLWPIPVIAIVAAVGIGLLLPWLDRSVDTVLPEGIDAVVFNGGAQSARSVLSSIAGSLITATSLTFSLTVVSLQLASSQASPRVLRLFAQDSVVHGTLALFLGTFAFTIMTLRTIRDPSLDSAAVVPRMAVTLALMLTLASVLMLVFFLAHLARQLRVETMLKDIHAETDRTIALVSEAHEAHNAFRGTVLRRAPNQPVVARSSGFITRYDQSAVLAIAERHGLVVEELKLIGESSISGSALLRYRRTRQSSGHDEAIEDELRGAFSIDYERTSAQDADYGVQQIVDIGVRALSPGINDPTTALHALAHLAALLSDCLAMPQPPPALAGEDGALRVLTHTRSRTQTIEGTLGQMRRYGAADFPVVKRMLDLLDDLLVVHPESDIATAVETQLDALAAAVDKNGFGREESRVIATRSAEVRRRARALTRRRPAARAAWRSRS
ncbi:DUF2254 domain-containing protein [Lacisediminihabitans sp. FW035]